MNGPTNNRFKTGCVWACILITLIMIGSFFLMTFINGASAVRLLKGHETAEATVTVSGRNREPSHYKFTIEGETYHGRGGEQEKAGETTNVAYLETNPSVNRQVDGLYKDIVFAAGIPLVFAFLAYLAFTSPKLPSGNPAATTPENH